MFGHRLPQACGENTNRDAMDNLRSTMCFIVEWFREDLPVEDAAGTTIMNLMAQRPWFDGLPPAPIAAPTPEKVLVFPDSYGYCDDIIKLAPAGRIETAKVVTKSPAKISAEEVKEIVGDGYDLILFGSGIDTPESNSLPDILAHQEVVGKLFLNILKLIARNPRSCKRLACVTCDAFSNNEEIHEEVGLGIITNSFLFGMCNVARLELEIPVQYIDTEWSLAKESVPRLASDLFRLETFGQDTLRILNDGRYVYRKVLAGPYEKRDQKVEFPGRGIIAITGGNGSLAQVMGMWILSRIKQAHGRRKSRDELVIKFLSRSCKISDINMPNWKVIQHLAEELNIVVEQCRCDCSDPASVDEFISECTPNLTAFVHTAGILHDSMIVNQTWDLFDEVWNPKSRAALYIHDALERFKNPDLDVFLMFSSMAVYGDMGQTNYSAANAFLDGLARHRRALGMPAAAMQFGAWGEAGMAASLPQRIKEQIAAGARPFFSNAEGVAGIEAGLRTSVPHFAVLKFNPEVQAWSCQGDQTTTQCYLRNWLSEFVPIPPPQWGRVDRQNLLAHFRCQQDGARQAAYCRDLWQGLVFCQFVDPWLSDSARRSLERREMPWYVRMAHPYTQHQR